MKIKEAFRSAARRYEKSAGCAARNSEYNANPQPGGLNMNNLQ
jgi:hypothetical protein